MHPKRASRRSQPSGDSGLPASLEGGAAPADAGPARMHFISGMPRSGSTLLAALLRQNPRFHASMSSGLAPLVTANLDLLSGGTELPLLIPAERRPAILRALLDVYYSGPDRKPVVFDTNRTWCARLPLLADLVPDAKVIATVRDVPWVLDSLERKFRQDPYETTRLFGGDGERATVYSRVEALARHNRLVGYAWTALKEAYYGEQSNRLLVVDYEYLARAPLKVLRLIYDFIGEPWYDGHDVENVVYDAPEFDTALGVKGLHKVRPQVRFEPRRTILPPDLFAKYNGMDFWKDPAGSAAHTIAPKKADGQAGEG